MRLACVGGTVGLYDIATLGRCLPWHVTHGAVFVVLVCALTFAVLPAVFALLLVKLQLLLREQNAKRNLCTKKCTKVCKSNIIQ